MTVRTVRSISRDFSAVSRMNSDSGVVTRMCGASLRILCRSAAGVSPVRTAVLIGASDRPRSAASSAISASGRSRFFCTSFDSALSGETYRIWVSFASVLSRAARTRPSRQIRNAASVLPDPVGAEIRTLRPVRISRQPAICGSVGFPNRLVNHSDTNGSKSDSGISASY